MLGFPELEGVEQLERKAAVIRLARLHDHAGGVDNELALGVGLDAPLADVEVVDRVDLGAHERRQQGRVGADVLDEAEAVALVLMVPVVVRRHKSEVAQDRHEAPREDAAALARVAERSLDAIEAAVLRRPIDATFEDGVFAVFHPRRAGRERAVAKLVHAREALARAREYQARRPVPVARAGEGLVVIEHSVIRTVFGIHGLDDGFRFEVGLLLHDVDQTRRIGRAVDDRAGALEHLDSLEDGAIGGRVERLAVAQQVGRGEAADRVALLLARAAGVGDATDVAQRVLDLDAAAIREELRREHDEGNRHLLDGQREAEAARAGLRAVALEGVGLHGERIEHDGGAGGGLTERGGGATGGAEEEAEGFDHGVGGNEFAAPV